MKLILLSCLLLVGCASPHFIADKDPWVSIGPIFNQTMFYCERVSIKSDMIPICTEAIMLTERNREKMIQYKNAVK